MEHILPRPSWSTLVERMVRFGVLGRSARKADFNSSATEPEAEESLSPEKLVRHERIPKVHEAIEKSLLIVLASMLLRLSRAE